MKVNSLIVFLCLFTVSVFSQDTTTSAATEPVSAKGNYLAESELIIPFAMISSLVSPGLGLIETDHLMSGLMWTGLDAIILSQVIFNKEIANNKSVFPVFLGVVIAGRIVAVPISVLTAGQYIDKYKKTAISFHDNGIFITYSF
jgi:hypothetical protein